MPEWFPTLAAMLAQDPTANALGGASGWVGAGLLGLVLAWLLMIHLPAKDKQLRELMEAKDRQVEGLLTREREVVQQLAKDNREGLERIAAHCEGEMGKMAGSWQKQLGSLTEAIQDLAVKVDQMRYPPRDNFGVQKT